jgi:hypothetical protein
LESKNEEKKIKLNLKKKFKKKKIIKCLPQQGLHFQISQQAPALGHLSARMAAL